MSKIAFPRTMRNTDPRQLSRALDENMRYLERLLNATFEMDHSLLSNVTSGQHHVKYTDAEVDTIVATHDAIASAHHAKYLDADAVSAMGAKADGNPLNHDQAAVLAEGAWTPTLQGETTDPTVTYTTQAGRYTKLGRQVTVWYTINLATVSTQGVGAWLIHDLPFDFASDVEGWQPMGSGDYYDGATNNSLVLRRHSGAADHLSMIYDYDGDGDSEAMGPGTETLAAGDVFAGFVTYLTDD